MKKNIIFVFGTRPEVIKLAPVILDFKKHTDIFNIIVCNTQQQKELSNQALEYFGIVADINLDVMTDNQTLSMVQKKILDRLSGVFANNSIDATIVQGDTMSVFAGALVSFYNKVPVFHVEAGLRSYNLFEPFPEEAIRQMVSRIALLHFVPTEISKQALLKENIDENKIFITGNTAIDALNCITDDQLLTAKGSLKKDDININDKIILVTIHRRENHGERLSSILDGLKELSQKYHDNLFIIPVHPNPNVRNKIFEELGQYKNIKLTEPLSYPELVFVMQKSKLVLTDSGGIQEECPTFGCPVLVLRYKTERVEGIETGHSILVGANKEKIISECDKILQKDFSLSRIKKANPYGDGMASKRIIDIIIKHFEIIK